MPWVALSQAPDLTPLLPPDRAETRALRQAVLAGDLSRAAALATTLPAIESQLWKGILAITRNDPTTAIRALRAGTHPKALGVAYYLARQHLLFRGQMELAMRQDPRDFAPYYYLGRHYDSDLDNCDEAVRWFRQAIERNPDYLKAQAYLGSCLERLGQLPQAEQAYRASLTVPLSQLGIAHLKFAAGDTRQALAWAEKALAADPRDATGQRFAARLYETLGRTADAIRALELAAQAAPFEPSIHYALFRLHRSAANEAKAAAALREFERLRGIYGSQPR